MIRVFRFVLAQMGQGLAEYGIVLGMIAMVSFVAIVFLGGGSRFR